ncbi:MAG TPA: biotin transporter BioY [Anaerolineales bacterium]|nr:biotin transporter BioY [Anaerolineales bacterium]
MHSTLALTLTRRLSARNALLTDTLLIIGGSLFVALVAQVSIPLPFTPVPITGQTFAVLIVGAALGAKRGAASLALYIAEGAIGLPVFSGGAGGMTRLFGPTGGYLVGFVVAAFVVGLLAERGLDRHWRTSLIPFVVGSLAIYLCGVAQLAFFTGASAALEKGLYPFLIGDAIKLVLAAVALPSAWAFVKGIDKQ